MLHQLRGNERLCRTAGFFGVSRITVNEHGRECAIHQQYHLSGETFRIPDVYLRVLTGKPALEPLLVIREDVPLVASPELAKAFGPSPSVAEILEKAPRYLNLNWWQIAPPAAICWRATAC